MLMARCIMPCVCFALLLALASLPFEVSAQFAACATVSGNLVNSSCTPPQFGNVITLTGNPCPYGLVNGSGQYAFAKGVNMNTFQFPAVPLAPAVGIRFFNLSLVLQATVYPSGLGFYWGTDGVNYPNFIGSLIDVVTNGVNTQYYFPFAVSTSAASLYLAAVGFNNPNYIFFNFGMVLQSATSAVVARIAYPPFANVVLPLVITTASVSFGNTDPLAAVDYFVLQLTLNGAIVSSVNVAAQSTTTSQSYTFIALTLGGQYSLSVQAHNAFGLSAATVRFFTPGTVPSAPSVVQISAGMSANSALVHIQQPANIGFSPLTSYTAYVASSTGSSQTLASLPVNLAVSLTGLTEGASYTVILVAVNAYGASSNSTAFSFVQHSLPTVGLSFADLNVIHSWFMTTPAAQPAQLQLNGSAVASWQPAYYTQANNGPMGFQQIVPAYSAYEPPLVSAGGISALSFSGSNFLPVILPTSTFVYSMIGVWWYSSTAVARNCLGFVLGATSNQIYGNAANGDMVDPSHNTALSAVYLNGTASGYAMNTPFFSTPTVVSIQLSAPIVMSAAALNGQQPANVLGSRVVYSAPDIFSSGGPNAFCGSVAELILFLNPVSDSGRQQVENYLSAKYSLPLLRPSCAAVNNCTGNGFCVATNRCSCSIGYTGASCNSCAAGYYSGGLSTCSVCPSCGAHGASCNPVSGACICATGWTGASCTECAFGYYGATCAPQPTVATVSPTTFYDASGAVITVTGANLAAPSPLSASCIFSNLADGTVQTIAGGYTTFPTSFSCNVAPNAIRAGNYSLSFAVIGSGGVVQPVTLGIPVWLVSVLAQCPAGSDPLNPCSGNGVCQLGTCICNSNPTAPIFGSICNQTQTLNAFPASVSVVAGTVSLASFLFTATQNAVPALPYLWTVTGIPADSKPALTHSFTLGSAENVLDVEVPASAHGQYTILVSITAPQFTLTQKVTLNVAA